MWRGVGCLAAWLASWLPAGCPLIRELVTESRLYPAPANARNRRLIRELVTKTGCAGC